MCSICGDEMGLSSRMQKRYQAVAILLSSIATDERAFGAPQHEFRRFVAALHRGTRTAY
jgi:hypothetical protein